MLLRHMILLPWGRCSYAVLCLWCYLKGHAKLLQSSTLPWFAAGVTAPGCQAHHATEVADTHVPAGTAGERATCSRKQGKHRAPLITFHYPHCFQCSFRIYSCRQLVCSTWQQRLGGGTASCRKRQACNRQISALSISCALAGDALRLSSVCFAGLISAAPGRRNSIMQNSAKQVEGMVRMKMEQREYIILCLEDTNDWSNATTRRLVMQVFSLHKVCTISNSTEPRD